MGLIAVPREVDFVPLRLIIVPRGVDSCSSHFVFCRGNMHFIEILGLIVVPLGVDIVPLGLIVVPRTVDCCSSWG